MDDDLLARAESSSGPTPRGWSSSGRVLRLCSVFEPAADVLALPDAAAFDPIGGMQNHTAELSRQLARLGVPQTVLTSRLGGPRRTEHFAPAVEVVRTGVPVRSARQLWAADAARHALALDDVALVHAHQGEDLAVLPLAHLVARRAGVPTVATVHTSVLSTVDRSSGRRPLTVLGPAVERWGLRAADAVVALTPGAARSLAAAGVDPARVHVMPPGYAPALFRRRYDDPLPDLPRGRRVLFVGRLAPQKRPLDAIAAHALLDGDVHLVVVGDGPLRAQVERAVAASPAGDRVRLVGFVPHERIPAYLQHADALVLPSQYEELGSVLVEAMASRLPVVANRVGGVPELVRDGENGLLAERGDVQGLARQVSRVLSDGDLAADLVTCAEQHVQQAFAWPALAARVLELYERVLAEVSSRRRR